MLYLVLEVQKEAKISKICHNLNYCNSTLWQYGLLSFQAGGIKLDRFLPKNQHSTYSKEIIEF